MSSSAPKDHFHFMVMHKIPSHLSKTEFETKVEALADEALQLPLVQTNLLKLEISSTIPHHPDIVPLTVRQIFQENTLDEHFKAFDVAPREHVVLVEVHCELVGDPEVRRLVEKGKEFGPPSGSYVFAADVVPKYDNPAPRDSAAHVISVYNVPPHVSSRKFEHDQKFEEFIDNFLAAPKVKKNVVRLEMWKHNNMLDDHIRALGYAEAGPVYIHHAIIENWDSALEIMEDLEAQQFFMNAGNAGRDFNLKTDCYGFHGRVVTKLLGWLEKQKLDNPEIKGSFPSTSDSGSSPLALDPKAWSSGQAVLKDCGNKHCHQERQGTSPFIRGESSGLRGHRIDKLMTTPPTATNCKSRGFRGSMVVRMRVGQFNRSTIRAVGYLWSKRGQWLNMRQATVSKSGEMNVQKKVGMKQRGYAKEEEGRREMAQPRSHLLKEQFIKYRRRIIATRSWLAESFAGEAD
ncbi:hypothetical protein B0H13DRAFT_1885086 [Mycena leptocephala]|nr:hypothetical protein B0H13DRAFT_1885086 [Mycena leptocephala]